MLGKFGGILLGSCSWSIAGLILAILNHNGLPLVSLYASSSGLLTCGFQTPPNTMTAHLCNAGPSTALAISWGFMLPLIVRLFGFRITSILMIFSTLGIIFLAYLLDPLQMPSLLGIVSLIIPSVMFSAFQGDFTANIFVAMIAGLILGAFLGLLFTAMKKPMVSLSMAAGITLVYIISGIIFLLFYVYNLSHSNVYNGLGILIAFLISSIGGILDNMIIYRYLERYNRHFA